MRFNFAGLPLKIFITFLFIISCTKAANFSNAKRLSVSNLQTSNSIQGGTNVDSPPPWIAAIYRNPTGGVPSCTGEFITNQYVLTARHCLEADNILNPVRYVAYVNNNSSKDRVATQSDILYENADIALMKLSKPYIGITNYVSFFHGYYYNPYNKDKNIKQFLAMGYGKIAQNVENSKSELKQLFVDAFGSMDPSSLITTSSWGSLLTGDSGGPLLYLSNFNLKPYKQLIGVASTDNTALTEYAILTPSVLKWIAQEVNIPIFKSPVDSGQVSLYKNSILFSGWGKFPDLGVIKVYDNTEKLIATCDDNQVEDKGGYWECQANNVETNYVYNHSSFYMAKITGLLWGYKDMVFFKVTLNGIDVSIKHPESGFTYTTPVGTTYLITGTATSGHSLKYGLADVNNINKIIDEEPCDNTDSSVVNDNGIWECRIKVKDSIESNLYFIARDILINPGEVNNISSVKYKVLPQSVKLIIESPLADSIQYYKHNIKININKQPTARYMPIYINNINRGIITIPQDTDHLDYELEISRDNNRKKVNVRIEYYINNDNKPAIESNITYFVDNPQITIESPEQQQEFGADLNATGKAFVLDEQSHEIDVASGWVRLYANSYQNPNKQLICETSISKGSWQCPVKHNFFNQDGEFMLYAELYNNEKSLLLNRVSVDILVDKLTEVKVLYPSRAHN